jgi:hypothetical protein
MNAKIAVIPDFSYFSAKILTEWKTILPFLWLSINVTNLRI